MEKNIGTVCIVRRAVVSERVRLAMGMSLRPEDVRFILQQEWKKVIFSEKYYEPPLMQVVPSACAACEERGYEGQQYV